MYPYNPFPSDPMFQAQMPDSYNNPLNFGAYGINPAQAGWNVNSAYMTPSFMAGYRPGYMGRQNFQAPPMGFGRAVMTGFPSPFQPEAPVYSDPLQYRFGAASQMGSHPFDAAMGVGQVLGSVAVGLAVQGAADAWRIPFGAQSHFKSLGYSYRMMAPQWAGGSPTRRIAAQMARSQTLLEAGGHYLGAGAGRLAGHGMSAAVRVGSLGMIRGIPGLGAMLGTAGAFAGAAAGSLLAPFALGTAVMEGANQAVFTPYTSGRQAADVLQDSYAGTYTGMGLSSAPLNVSNVAANRLGFAAARSFTDDMTFDQSTAAPMIGYGMQAGLFRGTNFNKQAIIERTRSMAQGVKVMMEVFNDPSIQDAIQRLGQLALTGGITSTGGLSALGQRYRVASATSGIGSRELMDTYGNQGQFMYGQAGLVPYLGQFAAINAASGFSVAQRLGLVTAPSLAAMGGIGGAVQSSMSAQLGLARTPYNAISAFNSQYLGQGGGGIVGNLSTFGNYMASNPLSAYGNFILNKNEAISSQISKDPGAVLDQVFQLGGMYPGAMKHGKMDAGSFAAILQSMGVSPEESRALLIQMKAMKDPRAKMLSQGASVAALDSSYASALERSKLTHYGHGAFNLGSLNYGLTSMGRSIQNWGSEVMENVGSAQASISDSLSNLFFGMSNNVSLRTDSSGINLGGLNESQWLSSSDVSLSSPMYNELAYEMIKKGRPGMGRLVSQAMGMKSYNRGMPADVKSKLNILSRLSSSDKQLAGALAGVSGGRIPTNEQMSPVMRSLGIGREEANDLLAYYSAQTGSPVTRKDVPFDMLIGEAKDYFVQNLGAQLKDYSYVDVLKSRAGNLNSEDLAVLATFVQENASALESEDSFLQAMTTPGNGSEKVKGVLGKLGLLEGITGSGPKAASLLKTARAVLASALGAYVTDPSFRKLGVAGSLSRASGKGFDKKGLVSALVKTSGAVGSSTPGRKSAVPMSVNELIGQASAINTNISEAMTSGGSMAKYANKIDFSGLAEASEKQQKAGELQLEAASLFERAVYNWLKPEARSGLTWMGINADGTQKNVTEQEKHTLYSPLKFPMETR